jgi:hypothetical protein
MASKVKAPKLAKSVAAPPRVWMVSPAFDLTFFVATALVTVIPWIAIEHYRVNPFLVIAGVAIVANGPHLASTWTRVYLDGNERWRRPFHYWVMPIAIATTVVLLTLVFEYPHSPTLRTVLFYWAFWHFMMQNWGILRIYQRRTGDADQPIAQLERTVLWLGGLYPVLSRLHTGPWILLGAKVKHPTIDLWMVHVALGALITVAAIYVIVQVRRLVRGERIPWIRPLFLLACFFGFLVPFVLIKRSGSAAFAAAACWHGFQYIGIVWFYNRNRWKGGVDKKATLVSWISQPKRIPLYFMALLALVGVFYGFATLGAQVKYNADIWASLVWLSLTFGHYYLDGIIWKLRKPELQKQLVTV